MELTEHHRNTLGSLCHQQPQYQPSLSLEILADESLPLLDRYRQSANDEMAAIHMTTQVPAFSSQHTSMINTRKYGICRNSNIDSRWLAPASNGRVNVIEALQEFWLKKLSGSGSLADSDSMISYACEPADCPPHVCFVTVPGGCSFGTLHHCTDRAEARRGAAHIALVNCIYNELPLRKITDQFIEDAIMETIQCNAAADLSSVGAFRFVLQAVRGQTMLDYTALANRLLVMHWSGALRSMHAASRQDLLKCALLTPWFSEDYQSELALEWLAVERTEPGRIDSELQTAQCQLLQLRQTGRELAFARLKRDVLKLAASQLDNI